jgi:hypothetical protein
MFRGIQEAKMFGIEWLKSGSPVEKETSVSMIEADAISGARARAAGVIKRHPGTEPDSFRLSDATGRVIGVFPIAVR